MLNMDAQAMFLPALMVHLVSRLRAAAR